MRAAAARQQPMRQISTTAARRHKTEHQQSRTTHFGFETVNEEEKAGRVAGVFTSVAESYDKMNDLMSFGVHRLWKYGQNCPPMKMPPPPPSKKLVTMTPTDINANQSDSHQQGLLRFLTKPRCDDSAWPTAKNPRCGWRHRRHCLSHDLARPRPKRQPQHPRHHLRH
ncbi:Ubiquinone/menaquinone biosynthesis methyltransferase ubiE [Beauveria bassiana D1-5]|uniref:Ubiquinone/menaquinone biosynthesis methyltransferase ubiE n=1 Tax=Beauveria bassiana D1-5 TaxID=1245745 RepID=A0A0A2VQK5_BEABA|nr:Ubiquinone/menaquinone biosynthesis methyltransferase ubiE [Beauveria bassiana D1-5]